MYLYLYFKYFFGWLLVLVLKILLQSILPNTGDTYIHTHKSSSTGHDSTDEAFCTASWCCCCCFEM